MFKLCRLVLITFIVFAAFLVFSAGVFAEGERSGVVTGNGVNVREAPDLSAAVLTQLNKNDKVKVIGESNGWYNITYGNITGWMHSDYVTIKDEAIATGVINANAVNIRTEPDLSSDIITRLDNGVKLDVYERTSEWYRVKLSDGTFGWVYKTYLTIRDSNASRGNDENASSTTGQKIVEFAKTLLGVRYKYGGASPSSGFDCSGFVYYVYKQFGITLERSSRDQSQKGTKVDKADLVPGDLVFFDTNGGRNGVNHVGIYIGDGKFIHSSSGSSKRKVVISSLNEDFYKNAYMTARRYIR
ncbi:MAG TPA: SH3 domain-containing protein [Clostridiaceae bacterium]|nr:SH3 domain-containing protein [Clostridiaceae bacterium]